jgi:sulfoxide reductase heme-binding subunit YedZ
VALDLIAALVVTSLMRARISRRFWRGIHWLAYAAWPVALVHSFGSSPDLRSGGLLALAIGCALAVGAAGLWRLAGAIRRVPRAQRAAVTLGGTRPGELARQARAGEGGAR